MAGCRPACKTGDNSCAFPPRRASPSRPRLPARSRWPPRCPSRRSPRRTRRPPHRRRFSRLFSDCSLRWLTENTIGHYFVRPLGPRGLKKLLAKGFTSLVKSSLCTSRPSAFSTRIRYFSQFTTTPLATQFPRQQVPIINLRVNVHTSIREL
jgi:hypothetical protein